MEPYPKTEYRPKRSLSPRQKQVLIEIATGKSRRVIATELGISIHTLRSYLYTAYDRMGVHNALEAVAALPSLDDAEANQ